MEIQDQSDHLQIFRRKIEDDEEVAEEKKRVLLIKIKIWDSLGRW